MFDVKELESLDQNYFTVLYKDDALNNHEKCQGNAYLVEKKWATFIKGSDNLDEITNGILDKEVIVQKGIFD